MRFDFILLIIIVLLWECEPLKVRLPIGKIIGKLFRRQSSLAKLNLENSRSIDGLIYHTIFFKLKKINAVDWLSFVDKKDAAQLCSYVIMKEIVHCNNNGFPVVRLANNIGRALFYAMGIRDVGKWEETRVGIQVLSMLADCERDGRCFSFIRKQKELCIVMNHKHFAVEKTILKEIYSKSLPKLNFKRVPTSFLLNKNQVIEHRYKQNKDSLLHSIRYHDRQHSGRVADLNRDSKLGIMGQSLSAMNRQAWRVNHRMLRILQSAPANDMLRHPIKKRLLSHAESLLNSSFTYTYNLDFRGRAYPVGNALVHTGSDLSRSLLVFGEGKPLGESGFRNLMLHLAGLYGKSNNIDTRKLSISQKLSFIDGNMMNIIDSAVNPWNGNKWWSLSENPYQTLSTCMEIYNALLHAGYQDNKILNVTILKRNLSSYVSNLPVHIDGSCNGLQHYAALSRSTPEAIAVNLMNRMDTNNSHILLASDESSLKGTGPLDVYSEVLKLINRRLKALSESSELSNANRYGTKGKMYALLLLSNYTTDSSLTSLFPIITRSMIKKAVMTLISYGISRSGAKLQILSQLEPKLNQIFSSNRVFEGCTADDIDEISEFLTDLVISCVNDKFTSTRNVINYLKKVAEHSSNKYLWNSSSYLEWKLPVSNFTVVQPWHISKQYYEKELFNAIRGSGVIASDVRVPVFKTLRSLDKSHSVNGFIKYANIKRISSFPPNFIHSLDACHMHLTNQRMQSMGKSFASVHDSYWTHAGDVSVLNELLRETFIEMHSDPILSQLAVRNEVSEGLVPPVGKFNLEFVRNSTYFFH